MDSQHLKQFLLLAFSAAAAALAISPSHGVPYRTLYTICSQSQSEEACVKILQSDPHTGSATLPQLSLISIGLARNQASKNYQVFTDLWKNNTSPPLKAAYDDCRTIYNQMKVKINEANQLSLQGRYKDIHQLGDAQSLAYKCENGLPSSSKTAPDTETMVLTCQASWSVISYILSSTPQ